MITVYLYPPEPNPNDVRLTDPTILAGGVSVVVEADGHAAGQAFVFGDSTAPTEEPAHRFAGYSPHSEKRKDDRLQQAADDLEVVMVLAEFLGRTTY